MAINENYNVAAYGYTGKEDDATIQKAANWGKGAIRSASSVFSNLGRTDKTTFGRAFETSRLWQGCPQLTDDQLSMFEAAYTGHTFFFVIDVPKFMYKGIYEGTMMHQHAKNLRAFIERDATAFSGFSPIQANISEIEDGAGRKLSFVTSVTKEQSNISIRLHEFAGLPLKNAIESWLTGIYDIRSQHAHYHGNLGIKDGWCLKNHSMKLLVVQVSPDWTTIQDAAYYYNMVPIEVPFDHFSFTKGEHELVQDYDLDFVCNEDRSPAVMLAAEKYMNNKILSMVGTSCFNSRQFVPFNFSESLKAKNGLPSIMYDGAVNNEMQYNMYYTNENLDPYKKQSAGNTFVNNMKDVDSTVRTQVVNSDGNDQTEDQSQHQF